MPLLKGHRGNNFIIAIDGPSATGKTTLSKALAKRTGFALLLTGKIYRAYAKILIEENVASDDLTKIIERIADFDLLVLDHNLEGEAIAKIASVISSYPEVRKLADQLQFDFIKKNPQAILEGRDIGTVICPDADLKIFLTATPEVRAKRRLAESGGGDYLEVLEQIIERDKRDSNRAISPLIPANDAIIIDNSELTQKDQLEKVLALLPISVFD
jgi:cytidylate kinase